MSLPLGELAATQTYLFVFIHCCENKQSEQIMMQQLLFFILVTKLFTLDISTTHCKSHFYRYLSNYTERPVFLKIYKKGLDKNLHTAELIDWYFVEYKDSKSSPTFSLVEGNKSWCNLINLTKTRNCWTFLKSSGNGFSCGEIVSFFVRRKWHSRCNLIGLKVF